jgi:hypothetical protein
MVMFSSMFGASFIHRDMFHITRSYCVFFPGFGNKVRVSSNILGFRLQRHVIVSDEVTPCSSRM